MAITLSAVDFDPPKYEAIEIPNGLIMMVDSDHARDPSTRRSCEMAMALILGVAVDWKHGQQKFVAIHSTDSETRAMFTGVKCGFNIQDVAEII